MIERVAEVFARAEARAASPGPLRITDDGIFLATPLEVASEALGAVREGLGPRPRLLDAGMGDGRIVALAHLLGFDAFGLETDATLFESAGASLCELEVPAKIGSGSFLDPASYGALGALPHELDVVMNYPDGNEGALGAFFASHGRKGAVVAFLTPDMALRCPALALERTLALGSRFRLYVHRV
jgi:hypothetical protein